MIRVALFLVIALAAAGCAKSTRIYAYNEVTFTGGDNSGFDALSRLNPPYAATGTLLCRIGGTGALSDCAVEKIDSKAPADRHAAMETAFLANAKSVRIDPKAKDGSDARGQRLRFTIRYAVGN